MADLLEEIPILSIVVKKCPSMDYEGQKLAEKLYQWIIILFAVVGFIWGFICQQFAQTVYILGAGVALACLIMLPPWGFFRRHPLEWQEPQQGKEKPAASSSSSSSSKKKRS